MRLVMKTWIDGAWRRLDFDGQAVRYGEQVLYEYKEGAWLIYEGGHSNMQWCIPKERDPYWDWIVVDGGEGDS